MSSASTLWTTCYVLKQVLSTLKRDTFRNVSLSRFQRFSLIILDYNPYVNWALRTTENVVRNAVTMSAPIVNKFDAPISYVDQTFVKGIDKLELSAPIIKEQPAEILNQAKSKVMDVVQPQLDKVCGLRKTGTQKAASLKELSYNKAKEVLATSYGSVAVTGIDSTAVLAERLLDSFFPKTEEDDLEDDNSECFKCKC